MPTHGPHSLKDLIGSANVFAEEARAVDVDDTSLLHGRLWQSIEKPKHNEIEHVNFFYNFLPRLASFLWIKNVFVDFMMNAP